MGLRRKTADTLRYVAHSVNTPVWVERVLLGLAERVFPHTALTCKHCGYRVEYRGDVNEQADRAFDHANTHYPEAS